MDPPAARLTYDSASGLGATWSATLPSQEAQYTLLVDGVGTGDPRTAGRYSDYGSLGNYRVTVSTGSVTATEPPEATEPLTFTTTSRLPNARKHKKYDVRITTADGEPAYAWRRVSGTIPKRPAAGEQRPAVRSDRRQSEGPRLVPLHAGGPRRDRGHRASYVPGPGPQLARSASPWPVRDDTPATMAAPASVAQLDRAAAF